MHAKVGGPRRVQKRGLGGLAKALCKIALAVEVDLAAYFNASRT
ncbi:MAG TPA: hypothetical protein VFG07_10510 [Thermoplasmata archaeon]|nr:hypothetical protein [Thermoplasmata archaeon]